MNKYIDIRCKECGALLARRENNGLFRIESKRNNISVAFYMGVIHCRGKKKIKGYTVPCKSIYLVNPFKVQTISSEIMLDKQ